MQGKRSVSFVAYRTFSRARKPVKLFPRYVTEDRNGFNPCFTCADFSLSPIPSACLGRVAGRKDSETATGRLITCSVPKTSAKASRASEEHSNFELHKYVIIRDDHLSPFRRDSNIKFRRREKITVNLPSRFPWLYVCKHRISPVIVGNHAICNRPVGIPVPHTLP